MFSTIINFGMLSLLRRLHRLQIQFTLQADSDHESPTEIVFPRLKNHRTKQGENIHMQHSLLCVTNAIIAEAVEKAEIKAKVALEKLGMGQLLQQHSMWDSKQLIPQVAIDHDDENEEFEGHKGEESHADQKEAVISSIIQEVCCEEPADVEADINTIYKDGLVDKEVKQTLQKLQQGLQLKKNPSTTVSMFTPVQPEESSTGPSMTSSSKQISPFVAVNMDSRTIFVRKTTAVWLFQEGERVSSDRLFRVRSKQPYASASSQLPHLLDNKVQPYVSKALQLGDLCVFQINGTLRIGRVLQFARYKGKPGQYIQHEGLSADLSSEQLEVMCSWYDKIPDSETIFQQSQAGCSTYQPASSYVCSLSANCLLSEDDETSSSCTVTSILPVKDKFTALLKQKFAIKEHCLKYVQMLVKGSSSLDSATNLKRAQEYESPSARISTENPHVSSNTSVNLIDIDSDDDKLPTKQPSSWLVIGRITLFEPDKDILLGTDWLNSSHLAAVQYLLKSQFPAIAGLQDTLAQDMGTLAKLPLGAVQVLYVDKNHWQVVSNIGCTSSDMILVYDSKYSTISNTTKQLIAQLLKTSKKSYTIQIANVTKQSGCNDCGVFAPAYCTALAHGQDPSTLIFNQGAMRQHLLQCLEEKKMVPFPTVRMRRAGIPQTITVEVFCSCRCPDDGSPMVCCDGNCGEWYHVKCTKLQVADVKQTRKWYCRKCT